MVGRGEAGKDEFLYRLVPLVGMGGVRDECTLRKAKTNLTSKNLN